MNLTKTPQLHRDWIDPQAFRIVKALQSEGFTTYLVGGCVRDLLLGLAPKDFDIGTNASPQSVKRIIPKAFIIGKRFRLVLVKRGEHQYEVATFRREATEEELQNPELSGDNLFGSPEEDANRRDFTVNALFYDPMGDQLIDYAHGLEDHQARLIRMIGEPKKRLLEDPIRILRALRLAHKIRFGIEPSLREAMQTEAESLVATALPRRREEWLKLLRLKSPENAFCEAYDLGLLQFISPTLQHVFENSDSRETFLTQLARLPIGGIDRSQPIELFSYLVHAYVRSTLEKDPTQPIKSRTLQENAPLHDFMSKELGMFKTEQLMATSALHLQSVLQRREEFERKGGRRQMAVMSRIGFPMALKFSLLDLTLSPSDWHFWLHLYNTAWLEMEDTEGAPPSRRRRSRNRRRKKAPKRANVESEKNLD
ncbi:MAG: poly(A) polymerase [Bdellovibrionales bacterium]|nr:poly(A) polymerase [Bdellovibrionales bacterium]